jgi:hypothetical protein
MQLYHCCPGSISNVLISWQGANISYRSTYSAFSIFPGFFCKSIAWIQLLMFFHACFPYRELPFASSADVTDQGGQKSRGIFCCRPQVSLSSRFHFHDIREDCLGRAGSFVTLLSLVDLIRVNQKLISYLCILSFFPILLFYLALKQWIKPSRRVIASYCFLSEM